MIDYLMEDADRFEGDYNRDSQIDVLDLDRLTEQIHKENPNLRFDLNGDGLVTQADRDVWLDEIGQMTLGDADQDGLFTSSDLLTVFVAAKYETDLSATWSEGDWNGDRLFDSHDLVTLYQSRLTNCLFDDDCGATAPVAVPEPNSYAVLMATFLVLSFVCRRRAF